ncbi:MAG TPA: tRNA-dihydrouridine synthase family protein [Candidatus Binatia bacterium]|nr:tRNA-dihydrouridine synthase family protein [Candidatus Binatia bacterium]
MTPHETFAALLQASTRAIETRRPVFSLAPMQDVTTLEFMRVMARYGGPDVYWTEYFRVHGDSRPEKWILDSITKNPTGKPVVAQLIGNDVAALVRTAKLLQQYPVAAIDLNLGCPAPIVYRKCAGGGLLREPQRIDAILSALREAVTIPFTVKTRIGFESAAEFDALLPLFAKHPIDLLTIHARTVAQMYRPGVRYDLIALAARELRCPVMLNGNVFSAAQAKQLLAETGACGLMIGRGAIRNPWLFDQIRAELRGENVTLPSGREVLAYIHELWDNEITPACVVEAGVPRLPPGSPAAGNQVPTGNSSARPRPGVTESAQVQRMKKFMNFIGEGVDAQFLHDIRRVNTTADFWRVCEQFLDHDDPMPLEPPDVSVTPLDLPKAF